MVHSNQRDRSPFGHSILASQSPTARVSALPQSPADVLPLLIAGMVLVALLIGIFNKYVDGGFDPATTAAASPSAPTVAPAPPVPTGPVAVSGRVGSLRIAAATTLPSRPGRFRSHPSCPAQAAHAQSPAALAAAKAGWRVTQDQNLAGYQLVVVDAGIERGRGGKCLPAGMSVLLFRGGALIAIAYSRTGPRAIWLTSVVPVSPDMVQLLGVDGPAAQLTLSPTTIHLSEMPQRR